MTESNRADQLKIQTPCPKTWDELEGGDRRRYCSSCELHVHNSEALSRDEAAELVGDSSSRVCMRIVQDESGAPVFRDSAPELPPLTQFARWALTAGAGLLAACRPTSATPTPPEPTELPPNGTPEATVGIVCPPMELGRVSFTEELGDVAMPPPDETLERLGKVVLHEHEPEAPPED